MDALILDFDGVIADSEPVHERAIAEAALALGVRLTHGDYMTRVIGLDDRDTFRVLARMAGRELAPHELALVVRAKQERVLAMVDSGEVRLFGATIALVREAHAAGIRVAICSGAARVEIERILEREGLRELFRGLVTADDVAHAKPDPAGYRLAAERLGVHPERCVAIEDTPRGIRAAMAAGLKVVGVCHSLAAEELGEADLVVRSSEELSLEMLRAF